MRKPFKKDRQRYPRKCAVYVSNEQFERLCKVTNRLRIPITRYWRAALEAKLNADDPRES